MTATPSSATPSRTTPSRTTASRTTPVDPAAAPASATARAALLDRLRDAPPATGWPADRSVPVPPLEQPRQRLVFEIPADLADGLAATAREQGVPVLATLAAGLRALLYRVASPWENTGVEEVVVGAGANGSWAPLRGRVDPDAAFADLASGAAGELRHVAGGEFAIGEPDGTAVADRCRAAVLLGSGDLPLDLVFAVDPEDARRGSLTYDGLRHGPDTAERVVAGYLELLRAAVRDPRTPIGLLPLVPSRTPSAPVPAGADADASPEADAWDITAHELFDRTAARHPDAPALRWDGGELTYAELRAAADRCADRIGTARVVALSGPRCPELIVALLAILKSGAGYVPLDSAYPRERLDHMLADSGAEVLIGPAGIDGDLTVPEGVRVIDLYGMPVDAPASPAGPVVPRTASTTADLCYVIYTSGSTGVPKGVAMPHRPLAALLDWQSRHSEAGPGWNTLQFAAFSFDGAFQEMFATWGTGGTLVLITDDVRRDPDRLVDWLSERSVHRLVLPFVALQQLAEASSRLGRYPSALREVITAGEQLLVSPLVREFFRHTGASLENQYGPSETHVVTAERLPADPADWPELPAIGHPIDRAVVEILDARLQPLPDGVPGEICVSGVPLADGYLGRPELTAERFVVREPAGAAAAPDRIYRTGDFGTRLPDGRIHYFGRRDGQIKVRGFRVELGEVEAQVLAQQGLADAVVVVRDGATEKQLIAYYRLTEGHDVPPRTLRAELARTLPGYMVPFACVAVTALPLTPSGKADRLTLAGRPLPQDLDAAYEAVLRERGPAGAAAAPPSPSADAPPSPSADASASPFAELLVELWADALARDTIGVHTDLFALGAESVTALKVASQLTEAFRLTVPPSMLFDRPTAAGQAAWFTARDAANDGRLSGIARLLLAYEA
ncbi:amino acid adenylation domain-containing protein [Kitasatospora purpeofusca]|uniref:amino acid adenylation domain-containing protein n=1 Tax=Kitasatospora purpeofusca TaxID=67352 RepID=UPI002A5A85A2|nr:amino acid adenylation domain-containing protein [Kitasatospora purpeofusca]MDY0814515.1 amino acid adenylation domain-containing protein [Kitasatospora purpeofusca]